MKDRIIEWTYNHPNMTIFLSVVFVSAVFWSIFFGVTSRLKQYKIEQANTADFVMYTSEGETLGVEHEVIVDMDTGYQYLVFNINGDYVAVPRVDEDGNFYKTVE